MRVCVAGAAGAFGVKHLDALSRIDGVSVTSVVGGGPDDIDGLARERGIGHTTRDLAESLSRDDVEAVILATPTQVHANQTIACLEAGKHVMCEIPMADSLAEWRRVVDAQKKSDLVAMVDHVRRFKPSHQWIHNKITAGEVTLQKLDVQKYFFRRSNTMPRVSRAAGQTFCCGTMPAARSIFSNTRQAVRRLKPLAYRDRSTPTLVLRWKPTPSLCPQRCATSTPPFPEIRKRP